MHSKNGRQALPTQSKKAAAVYQTALTLLFALGLAGAAAAESTTVFVIGDTGDCGEGPPQVSAAIRRDPAAARSWLLELGDLAYPTATAARLQECHEPFFGPALFPRRVAVPGNHDARDAELAGFRTLYPEVLPRTVDFGRWRVLMLDSNRRDEAWAEQLTWVGQAVKGAAGRCLIAAWHHPAWASGKHGDNAFAQPLWASLAGIATFTLHGHDHHYERLAPRDASGALAPQGTPSFVVGHGGATLYPVKELKAGSVATSGQWGYLKLELGDTRFRWQAFAVSSQLLDEGQGSCRPVPAE